MLKRFVIGFVLGVGLMYFYIHQSEGVIASASRWMEHSASGYRGDSSHRAVERATGGDPR